MAGSPPTPDDPIIAEAMRVEIDADYSARANFIGAGKSERAHTWLGIPATSLAALAASVAVGLPEAVAGGAALVAAVLTAVQTFVAADKRAATQHSIAAEFLDLRNRARVFREIDYAGMEPAERRRALDDLIRRRSELNPGYPIDLTARVRGGAQEHRGRRERLRRRHQAPDRRLIRADVTGPRTADPR